MLKSLYRCTLCIVLFLNCNLITAIHKTNSIIFSETIKFTKKNNCWLTDDTCLFSLPPLDQNKQYDIFLEINYTPDYIFHNIHLQYSINTNSEIEEKGTKDFNLFDESNGKPLGTKFLSKIFSINFPLIKNYKPISSEIHTIEIKQFMRTKSLEGIESITIKIIIV